jgi:DNA-directed RNA polymerase specialized sigma24 family protein
VHDAHDYDAIWRGSGATLWRAVYAYSGGRRDVADDAVAEAFARVMARGVEVRDPLAYLYRVAFRVASAELARSGLRCRRSRSRIRRRTACPTCSAR